MGALAVEIPVEAFASTDGGAPIQTQRWDGIGTAPGGMLRWAESSPMGDFAVAALMSIDPSQLDDEDLPTYLAECDRAESAFAARKHDAIRELASRTSHDEAVAISRAAPEVSFALRLPLTCAERDICYAQRLASHLPGTRRLFAEGKLTRWHINNIVEATLQLDQEQCARVEEKILDDAPDLSASEVRRRLLRIIARIKPTDSAKKHAEEAEKSDVTFQASSVGAMGWLTAYLPVHEAQLVYKAADHYARTRKKAGDKRRLGQLRCEFFVRHATEYLAGKLTNGQLPGAHGSPVTVNITITPESLDGLSDLPGEIPGIGPVPASVIRKLAEDARVRLQLIDPATGRLILRTKGYRPTAEQHAQSDATYVKAACPHSNVPADRCDTDHNVPAPRGETSSNNLSPFDRRWHIAKTKIRGLDVRQLPDGTIEWTTPLGQSLRVRPWDYRLGP